MPEPGAYGGSPEPDCGYSDGEEWAQLTLWPESYPSADYSSHAAVPMEEPHATIRIPDTCEGDRPRERLRAHGPRTLATAELLSLVLGTGNHAAGHPATDPARSILEALGAGGRNALQQLRYVTMEELQTLPGIGPARAAAIVAAIELGKRSFNEPPPERTCVDDPAIAASLLSHDLMWEREERFAVLMLDIKHHFIGKRVLSIGSQTETIANPREIFGEALRCRAVRIIVAHNHPSGSLEPSADDLAITRQLLKSGNVLGMPVLDHLILGEGRHQSLRQTTSLWQEIPQESAGERDVVHEPSSWSNFR